MSQPFIESVKMTEKEWIIYSINDLSEKSLNPYNMRKHIVPVVCINHAINFINLLPDKYVLPTINSYSRYGIELGWFCNAQYSLYILLYEEYDYDTSKMRSGVKISFENEKDNIILMERLSFTELEYKGLLSRKITDFLDKIVIENCCKIIRQ